MLLFRQENSHCNFFVIYYKELRLYLTLILY